MSCISLPSPSPTVGVWLVAFIFRAFRPKPTCGLPVILRALPFVILTQPDSGRVPWGGGVLQSKTLGVFGPVLGVVLIEPRFSGSELKVDSKKLWFITKAMMLMKWVGEPNSSSE